MSFVLHNTMSINFFAPGTPKPQPRARAFARMVRGKIVARVFDNASAEGWKGEVALACRDHVPAAPLTGPIMLRLDFLMARPQSHFRKVRGVTTDQIKPGTPNWHDGHKGDLDNLAKSVMDAMTALGFWKDDRQVVDLHLTKKFVPQGLRPGCAVQLLAMNTEAA